MAPSKTQSLRLALPKGSMQAKVFALLADAGIHLSAGDRDYRPKVSLDNVTAKLLRPQNIVEMLHAGSRDLGFAGADWVEEVDARLIEVLDTGLDPVRLVAAAPVQLVEEGLFEQRDQALVVASEYKRIATEWIRKKNLNATVLRSCGATEVFPPEDADCIVDNSASGSTLRANGLKVVDELMTSSTRIYANPKVMDDPVKKEIVDRFVLLIGSVLEARQRVMLEVNVDDQHLEAVISVLPCMRQPTISRLHGCDGYAVKVAVPREKLTWLIPEVKARGGSDIVVTKLAQIVP